MKIRIGFVSNSSSTSFCLAKHYMSEEQAAKFSAWLKDARQRGKELDWEDIKGDPNAITSDPTYIFNTRLYYFGEVDINSDMDKVVNYLLSIGVDNDKFCFMS